MRPLFAAWIVALAASCGGEGDSASALEAGHAAAAPNPAPSVVIADLAGVEAALASRRGRPLLVNFWAIW